MRRLRARYEIAGPSCSGDVFDRQCHAHAAAYAEGGEAALCFSLQHLVKQSDRDAGAGAADWMAESDRASVDIELVRDRSEDRGHKPEPAPQKLRSIRRDRSLSRRVCAWLPVS